MRLARIRGPAALPALSILLVPSALAQFDLDGHRVEVHGFFSQGFMYSDQNNYLTTKSSEGTFSLTDGGLNISSQITNKLRVGAQGYVRNVGSMGEGHVTLDWAFADYRLNDRFGIRAGRVKTVLGLYNDTQDMEFLHTWALLPQSLYPLDLRGLSISHLGADVYGSLHTRAGTLSYTAYAGLAPGDLAGGRVYGLSSYGYHINSLTGRMSGADLKWSPTRTGLLFGASYMNSFESIRGVCVNFNNAPFLTDAPLNNLVYSAQYSHGPWRLDWESSRTTTVPHVINTTAAGVVAQDIPYDLRGWYAAASFRLSKFLEVGSYHSRFYPNADEQVPALRVYLPPPARHIYDQAITARFDLKTHWDLKVEGHFMDGYGDAGTTRGFYPQNNPAGLKPKTNLLVIRLGFNL